MSVIPGIIKKTNHKKISETEYMKESNWTSSKTVERDNGHTVETDLSALENRTSNVENKSSETIRSEITSDNVTSALGYVPAELDENGIILSSMLPAFVDDVIEGSMNDDRTEFTETDTEEALTPESGKIYIDVNTNISYRWGGTVYVPVGSDLAIGETESTAYRGDRGKTAYDHSQTAHAPANAEENQEAFSNIKIGETIVAADDKTDTLEFVAGDNVTITADAETDKITISSTGGDNGVIITYDEWNALSESEKNSGTYYIPDFPGYDNHETDYSEAIAAKMDKMNPTGSGSFSMGRQENSVIGTNSFTMGENNVASREFSSAHGKDNSVTGYGSFVRGMENNIRGSHCYVEGIGNDIGVNGGYSFVHGRFNNVNNCNQTVFGMYNNNKGSSILEIGNGTSSERSNALEIDYNGNANFAGTIKSNNVNVQTISGDTKDNSTTFTSVDATSPTAWTDVGILKSGETHSSIFNKISTMFKNIKYLYKLLGNNNLIDYISNYTNYSEIISADQNITVNNVLSGHDTAIRSIGNAVTDLNRNLSLSSLQIADGVKLNKIGKYLHLYFNYPVNNPLTSGWNVLFTIPAQYIPEDYAITTVWEDVSNTFVGFSVDKGNGACSVWLPNAISSATRFRGNIAWEIS